MRAGGGCQPLRGSETSDGSDVRCQIIAPASPPIHPAAGPQLFFENPVIVINLRDLSTPRSCSDFADRVMRHANTARDDDIRQVSDGVAAQLLKASFLGRRGCFGRALRCLLGVQERLAKEPGLGILCRMPTEDPRAGPKLVPLLHTKAPSFQGPAVAPKATEVSCWKRRRRMSFPGS